MRWRWVGWVVGILIVLALLALIFIYSGLYNVAATYPDRGPVRWVLNTTMIHSVRRHAKGIKVPALNDRQMILIGLGHYRKNCIQCHGAPGVRPAELARGLNPHVPSLARIAKYWKPNELFWVTKNGVRMTGMPAWNKTHTDDEIWHITAFVQQLPTLTPSEYQALARQAPVEH